MITTLYIVDPVMKTVRPMTGHAVIENDHEADAIRFAFPDSIDLAEGTAVRVMYIRPDGGDPVAKTLAFYKHSGGYHLYDWVLQRGDLKKGTLTFSLCILSVSGGIISEEWHTTPCQISVLNTIHTDDSDEADETITPTVAERVAVLETMIQRVASGAPIVVTSTSAMTDTEQIYVLSTNGNWYYHNGSAWVSGGEYGAVATDTTLTQSGIPADAKVVGDAINAVTSDVEEVQDALEHLDVETDKTLSVDGKPADAEVVGDEIADLKVNLSETENEIIRTAGVIEELECGLTEEVKTTLLACFTRVAWIGDDGQTYYNALSNALNRSRVISSISAIFTQGSATIYDTDELYALKQYLTVTVTYSDGTTKEVNNYTLSGKLVAGTSTITVAYNKKTTTFNVIVTHQEKTLESISATFNSSASITTDNVLDDLRPYLTVRASYSDGSTNTITNYTLSGSLNVGENTITVAYNNKTATFTVNVTQAEKTLQSITATFTQGSAVIYTDSSLNDLRPYLVVTARYSDSTTQVVTGYTLIGTLTKGTSTITASYGGKTATFTVTVEEAGGGEGQVVKHYELSDSDTKLVQGGARTHEEYGLSIMSNMRRLVFGVNSGVQSYRSYTDGSAIDIYPIPIPESAIKAVVSASARSSYSLRVDLQTRNYDSTTKYSAAVDSTGWQNPADATIVFTPGVQYLVITIQRWENDAEAALSPSDMATVTVDFIK